MENPNELTIPAVEEPQPEYIPDESSTKGSESDPRVAWRKQVESSRLSAPIGAGEHVVEQGECFSNIGFRAGFFWETLWNYPENEVLKELRGDPYLLQPGDRVILPELRSKTETGDTEMKHRYRRKGVPEFLRLKLCEEDGNPRSDLEFELQIDGRYYSGRSDADGQIEVPISPNAVGAILIVRDAGTVERYPLQLGYINPISTDNGVQARLNNLGFECGSMDGKLGPRTHNALEQFQEQNGLKVTGEIDHSTREKIKEIHGF